MPKMPAYTAIRSLRYVGLGRYLNPEELKSYQYSLRLVLDIQQSTSLEPSIPNYVLPSQDNPYPRAENLASKSKNLNKDMDTYQANLMKKDK